MPDDQAMSQKHGIQIGTFHITTNTRNRFPWLTMDRVSEILIDNLVLTRNVYGAQLYAFCILPDHMHIIVSPGERGISAFMHSYKRNSSINVAQIIRSAGSHTRASLLNRGAGVYEPRLRKQKIYAWQNGFHDERIRDSRQRSETLGYVHGNAMKHGFVTDILDWPWTSLHFPHLLDPMETWL
jgi:putative transposase